MILRTSREKLVSGSTREPHRWSLSIDSGNGWMPSGNKPLPEPMCIRIYCHHMTSLDHSALRTVGMTAHLVPLNCRDFRAISSPILCKITSSNGNVFRINGPLWGESFGHRRIPLTKASDAELDVFFDLRLNKRLSKQSRCRWFETP